MARAEQNALPLSVGDRVEGKLRERFPRDQREALAHDALVLFGKFAEKPVYG